jgi:hypothetical protein
MFDDLSDNAEYGSGGESPKTTYNSNDEDQEERLKHVPVILKRKHKISDKVATKKPKRSVSPSIQTVVKSIYQSFLKFFSDETVVGEWILIEQKANVDENNIRQKLVKDYPFMQPVYVAPTDKSRIQSVLSDNIKKKAAASKAVRVGYTLERCNDVSKRASPKFDVSIIYIPNVLLS